MIWYYIKKYIHMQTFVVKVTSFCKFEYLTNSGTCVCSKFTIYLINHQHIFLSKTIYNINNYPQMCFWMPGWYYLTSCLRKNNLVLSHSITYFSLSLEALSVELRYSTLRFPRCQSNKNGNKIFHSPSGSRTYLPLLLQSDIHSFIFTIDTVTSIITLV